MNNNQGIEMSIDDLATIFYNNGHYYGYPHCCINEFILKHLVLHLLTTPTMPRKNIKKL